MNKRKSVKLKPKQFGWLKGCIFAWFFCLLACLIVWVIKKENKYLIGMAVILGIGVFCITAIYRKTRKIRKVSNLMEDYIRKNNLLQSHFVIKSGVFREKTRELIDYYPKVEYSENLQEDTFSLRFRLDGSAIAMRFRELEQSLADMFCTVCTGKIEERGYITFCFELYGQKQKVIESENDILPAEENEITFSDGMVWNWKKTPYFLLTGNTGSGKTQLTQYIIYCLISKGVRVIYCDPKKDDDMRYFLMNKAVTYVTEMSEIARVVKETEEELRLREMDLDDMRLSEAEFNPVFLIFDELIAFSKIADKRTYDETARRLAAIVVTGRSKRVYAGVILQRPDTAFIEGAIRDNLSCKICMGEMSETAYAMSFGSDYSKIKNYRREIGSGLIFRQGVDTKPREFLAPFIKEGALD